MGNSLTNETTKVDICRVYLLDYLIDNYGYTIHYFYNDKTNYKIFKEFMNIDLTKKIVRLYNIYICLITSDIDKEYVYQKLLLTPFIEGICKKDKETVDTVYAIQSFLQNDIVIFLGYSHINWCKMVSFITCNIHYNEAIAQNTPEINVLCAYSSERTLSLLEMNNNEDFVRPRVGTIVMYKLLQYLKNKGYFIVYLWCKFSLIKYYRGLGFKLGIKEDITFKQWRVVTKSGTKQNKDLIYENEKLIKKYGSDYAFIKDYTLIEGQPNFTEDTMYKMYLYLTDKNLGIIREDSMYRMSYIINNYKEESDDFKDYFNMRKDSFVNSMKESVVRCTEPKAIEYTSMVEESIIESDRFEIIN